MLWRPGRRNLQRPGKLRQSHLARLGELPRVDGLDAETDAMVTSGHPAGQLARQLYLLEHLPATAQGVPKRLHSGHLWDSLVPRCANKWLLGCA